MTHSKILLFDGVCNFCDGTVQFVLKHDKKEAFSFASSNRKPARACSGNTDSHLKITTVLSIWMKRRFIQNPLQLCAFSKSSAEYIERFIF